METAASNRKAREACMHKRSLTVQWLRHNAAQRKINQLLKFFPMTSNCWREDRAAESVDVDCVIARVSVCLLGESTT